MSRKRADRLKLIIELAERREQQAAAQLGQVRERQAAEQRRLQELRGYRDEYHGNRRPEARGGMSAAQLRNFKHFTGRLHNAVGQQQQVLEQFGRECERLEQRWRHARSRRVALEKLRVRYQEADARRQDRREQHLIDEHAARIYRSRQKSDA